jgi:hypothetical protein
LPEWRQSNWLTDVPGENIDSALSVSPSAILVFASKVCCQFLPVTAKGAKMRSRILEKQTLVKLSAGGALHARGLFEGAHPNRHDSGVPDSVMRR